MEVISVESVLYEGLKLVESILITMIAHLVAEESIHEATQWVTKLILKIKTIMNKFAWIDRIVNSTMMSNKNNNTYLLTAPFNDQNYMELQKFYTKD